MIFLKIYNLFFILIIFETDLVITKSMNLGFFRFFSFFILIFFSQNNFAQTYPPPAGQLGSSAIHKDSSVFVNWATTCSLSRGLQDISNSLLGLASSGDSSMALGKAQNNGAVSLGDGGFAICTFPFLIADGPGYDFAVFENSFDDSFLELAFVEVSSDGINFYRFSSHSKTDTINQTSTFGLTDATKLNNLAGKYRVGFGTPFDLSELSNKLGLNIQAITHIKIKDVVGSLQKPYATFDSFNNKINDPWPTPFLSSGFDLDAIGVIHESKIMLLTNQLLPQQINVYPNPVEKGDFLKVNYEEGGVLHLFDLYGKELLKNSYNLINTSNLEQGIYLLKIETSRGIKSVKVSVY